MPARDLIFQVLGIDRSASKTFNDVADAVDRFGQRATKAMAALAGASAASSLAVGGALAALPVAFAAVGAAALRNNAAVRGSFGDLRDLISGGLTEDAAVMSDAYVNAAHSMADAYAELRPQMRDAFAASIPAVEHLTAGVIGFAREAMPGMVTAARSSEPVFAALEYVLVATGRGAGEMFEIMAAGSSDAGRGIAVFGDLAEGVLPNVGDLLVDLAALWAEHGDQAVRVIVRLTGAAEDLGSHALPIVGQAMGVALDVLEGALAVIAPLADQLGPLIGLWLSLGLAMRTISGASLAISGVTGLVGKFQQGVDRAAGPQGAGKLSIAARGMLGIIGGPWAVALTAAGIALAVFGQRSEDAAQEQRSLAAALQESGGTFNDTARRLIENSKAYRSIADDIDTLGISHREFTDAIAAGNPGIDAMEAKLRALFEQPGLGKDQKYAIVGTLRSLDDLRGMVNGATEDLRRQAEAADAVGRSHFAAKPGADALAESMKSLGDKTATTADHADALNTAWRIMYGISLDLADAEAQFEQGIDDLHETFTATEEGVRTFDKSIVNASGTIDRGVQAGRDLHASLTDQGNAYRELAQVSYDTAIRQGRSQDEATATAEAAVATRRAQFEAEARSAGLTEQQVQALANTYLGFPGDILRTIEVNTAPAHAAIRTLVNVWDGTVVRIRVQATGDVQALTASGTASGLAARARGGPIDPGQWYRTGEEGEELIVPRMPGMVLPADHTRAILRALDAGGRATAVLAPAARTTTTAAPVINLYAGVIGSQRELDNWLVGAVDRLRSHGRM